MIIIKIEIYIYITFNKDYTKPVLRYVGSCEAI